VPFLGLPVIGLPQIDITSFIRLHPGLVHEVAGHALAHSLYSCMRRASRGASRRLTRRDMNRRRRWFVDNIIMHHKRLHDRNRELIVNNVRAKVLARKKALEKDPATITRDQRNAKWREKDSLKERGVVLRGRVDARLLRARSKWLSIAKQ
jgi:hypothetical protein